MRQAETKQSVLEFFMVFLKVVALHITLQMSGVYSQLYCKSRTDPDYNTVSPKPYIKNPFAPIVREGITWGTIIGVILLIIGSLAVRDVEYIKKMPGTFIGEGVMLAFFATIPLLLIGYNRYALSKEKATQFFVVFAAIAAIHIGFQLSGVYSIIYKNE